MRRKQPAEKPEDRTDWERVRRFGEAEIERMAAADAANPATAEEDWADARVGLPQRKMRYASLDGDVAPQAASPGRSSTAARPPRGERDKSREPR